MIRTIRNTAPTRHCIGPHHGCVVAQPMSLAVSLNKKGQEKDRVVVKTVGLASKSVLFTGRDVFTAYQSPKQ